MSQNLKHAESLYTDQHDANVISPVVNNSSDGAGQKNDKAGDNSYDEPAKRVSKTKRLPQQVSKINDTSQVKEQEIPLHQVQR